MNWTVTPVPPAGDEGGGDGGGNHLQFQVDGANLGNDSASTVNFTGAVTGSRTGGAITIDVTGGGGDGGATAIVELDETYVLSAADDNTVFWTDGTVTVLIPEGLNPPPACMFLSPAFGSITLHPTGVTTLDGGGDDVICTLGTYPSGVTLTPRYGHHDTYVTGGALSTFASLPDDPRANVQLAAYLDAKANKVAGLASLKLVSDYTLTQADNGRTFRMAGTAQRSITIPLGLSTDFRFFIAIMQVATAPVTVLPATGVPALIAVGMGGARPRTNVRTPGAVVEVRCTGDQDTFMCVASEYWGENPPLQITGNYTLQPTDDGATVEVTGTCTITVPLGLRLTEGIVFEMPVSGTVSFDPTGTTKINEATLTIARTSSDAPAVALMPKNAADSYILTGG